MKKLNFLLLLLVAVPLSAQIKSAPASSESVLIGNGDQIRLNVFDTPEMSGELRVSDSGEVRLPTGNLVKIAGLSVFDASRAVEKSLIETKLMNHPHVEITILKYATQFVSVEGQVKNPGNYDLDAPRGVRDVLAMAGGLGDLADHNVVVERKGTHERIKYHVANNTATEPEKQVMVYPGDQVIVPKVGLIFVLGDVGRPGAYPMQTNDSTINALQAIALAGGISNTAKASKSMMMREEPQGYRQIKLNLKEMEKGRSPNIPLLAGDIIYVPFSFGRNLAVNGASIVATASQAAIFRP